PEAIERPLPWDRYKIGQRFSQNKPPMEPPQE
ncbi:Na+/H+ antiporter subunit G, partial [Acinetobacter baumannii]